MDSSTAGRRRTARPSATESFVFVWFSLELTCSRASARGRPPGMAVGVGGGDVVELGCKPVLIHHHHRRIVISIVLSFLSFSSTASFIRAVAIYSAISESTSMLCHGA
ncbi:unnamed protein product [Pleuronectes platessa]|uniref:Uncharacterized protein n=1 Tax=Pleuronectes platessa TaxID=8262 RepID=A0A9N7V737_PLEPL|nr:unnamed protein product [Pleuronectes platessa]